MNNTKTIELKSDLFKDEELNDTDLMSVCGGADVPVVADGHSNFYLNILDLIGLRLDRGLLPALLGGSQ